MKARVLGSLWLPLLLSAQGTCNLGTNLRLGETKVAFSTKVALSLSPNVHPLRQLCGYTDAKDNIIHRVLYDREGKPYFGYDLHIVPEPRGKTFHVEVTNPSGRISVLDLRPAAQVDPRLAAGRIDIEGSKLRTFRQFPKPVTVADGDRVTFPVLQDPKTGATAVMDSFEIAGPGTFAQPLANLPGIPKEPPGGARLHLEQPSLSTGFADYGSNPEMGVSGPVAWIYSPTLGRILFSTEPRPGFLRTAFAYGNFIRFELRGDTYTLRLGTPAFAQSGTWQLWCKLEPQAPSPPGPWTPQELRQGLLALGLER